MCLLTIDSFAAGSLFATGSYLSFPIVLNLSQNGSVLMALPFVVGRPHRSHLEKYCQPDPVEIFFAAFGSFV